jgi:hypothetical protein
MTSRLCINDPQSARLCRHVGVDVLAAQLARRWPNSPRLIAFGDLDRFAFDVHLS